MNTTVTHILADRLQEGDVIDGPHNGAPLNGTVVIAARTQNAIGSPTIRCIVRESSKTFDFRAGSMVYIQGDHPEREGS